MTEPVVLVLGIVVAVALAVVSRRLELPYPIVFVIAGTLIAFIPGLPPVSIASDWIFITLLPPLLFSAGWLTDWVMFRKNLRPILQLAIGLVILTTVAVALVARQLLPMLGIAEAFVLGAIVSPPDAVAASAVFERFAVPRRIVAIVEGEGLLNDATALVIYAYAVVAVTTASFSLGEASRSFVFVAVGGVVVGLVLAIAVEAISRFLARYDLSDSLIENLLIIGCPYGAYLIGQAVHVSSVLAVVVAGIALSRRSSTVYGPQTRLIAWNVWTLWIYVLNAYIFLAIGLELRTFVEQGSRFYAFLPAALAISALVIVIRFVWLYPSAYIARLIPAVRINDPMPAAGVLVLIGWTGMRGIVSLAAAIALPPSFPRRDVIVFVTFVVIFVTLVGQGLTLKPLLRLLRLADEGGEHDRELEIRITALRAGLERILNLSRRTSGAHETEDLQRLRSEYESRIEHLQHQVGKPAPQNALEHPEDRRNQAEIEALRAERNAIMGLRDSGEIPDEIFRRIEYDLDLAESRLY